MNESPKNRVRVNRDDIRRMLGPYWVPTRENLVTQIEKATMRQSLIDEFSVIMDATNFKDQWIRETVKNIRFLPIHIEVQDFTTVPVEECIKRDALRPKAEQVGEKVIRDMHAKYLKK